jgi:hypothetical protein
MCGMSPMGRGPMTVLATPISIMDPDDHRRTQTTFADAAWGVRVPRSTRELLHVAPAATGHLTQPARPPTPVALADHLGANIDVLLADERRAGVAELGISRMHVSRLPCQTLAQLRVGFLASADAPPEEGPWHARR